MRTCLIAAPILLSLLVAFSAVARADDASAKAAGSDSASPSPGKEILKAMVGTWDEEVTMTGGKVVRGVTKTRLVLDNSYLLSESDIPLDDQRRVLHVAMMTWDEKQGVYREWMFSPTGEPLVSTTKYDEKQKTFTAHGKFGQSGPDVTMVTKLVSADRMEWTVDGKDKEGKSLFSFKGVNTRRKE